MTSTYYRIQDKRSALPAHSKNYYAEDGDPSHLSGVSVFCNLWCAVGDLLGGRSGDNWGTVYSRLIVDEGGEAVLVLVSGDFVEDDAGATVVIRPDLSTEKRFTATQVWAALINCCNENSDFDWSDFQGDWLDLQDTFNAEIDKHAFESLVNDKLEIYLAKA